jgi:putative spermidine/putrescine transport system ATP-binding protein/spermidine/putrescine transport system ATP-binding protein
MSTASARLMLEARNVTHRYGATLALDDVSLTAERGEFLTILGESGSGKTTMLRIIAGLERPTHAGFVAIDGVDVVNKPAAMRNCTTVFQHYALFPHMSVLENVGYGLKVRGVPRAEAQRRSQDALRMVRLTEKHDRRISQLSGGEKQRVALARALVTQPAILLLDEPLGALDEKLRFDMQAELVELHKTLGMTFVYITHSQEEALTMSDRVVLMRKGRIEQSGRPEELFDRPVSRFAAEFMGFENIMAATVVEVGGQHVVARIGNTLIRAVPADGAMMIAAGQDVAVAVRAERLSLVRAHAAAQYDNAVACTPGARLYRGKYVDQTANTVVGPLKARIWDRGVDLDEFNAVTWAAADCVVMSA